MGRGAVRGGRTARGADESFFGFPEVRAVLVGNRSALVARAYQLRAPLLVWAASGRRRALAGGVGSAAGCGYLSETEHGEGFDPTGRWVQVGPPASPTADVRAQAAAQRLLLVRELATRTGSYRCSAYPRPRPLPWP